MKCNSCGSEIPNGSTFCPFCGNQIKNENVESEVKENENVLTNEVNNGESDVLENTATYVMDATGEQPVVNPTFVSPPKKKKTGLIIGLIIGAIVLIAGIILGVGYFFEFKSADKRINVVVDNIFKKVNVTTENVEKSSGKFTVDGKISFDSQTYSAKLTSNYGIDLTNKLINLDMSLENLNIGMDIIDEPLKVNTYLTDDRIYFLLSNFYDKYIYSDVDGINEIFDAVEQNDINYQVILNGVRDAIKESLVAANKKQSIKNGKNVVRIDLTVENQKLVADAARKSLLNNDELLKELSKLTGKTEKELKASLEETETSEIEDNGGYFELVTDLMGKELIEFSIHDESVVLTINEKKVSIKVYDDGKLTGDIDLSFDTKKSSKVEECNLTLKATLYISEKAYTVDMTVNVESDVNPSVEKPDLKNAVSYENISQEDILSIYGKISDFGKLEVFLTQFLMQGTADEPELDDSNVYTYDYNY